MSYKNQMRKEMITINLNIITRGAMAMALIFISFSLFKGVTNILNAFIVPLVLYLCLINQKKKQIFTLYLAVIVFCIIFFNIQFFFIIFYCAVAFILTQLRQKKVNTILSTLTLTIAISFSFWIGIMLTDYFFLTHMNEIIMKVMKGNILKYGIMLIIEGALVGVSQLFVSSIFYKRLITIQK
ncbi:hypothetical protein [Clostridium lacusfryxellense]|uniref:hypothetical protein n=1 Tax=Clostridium lacusfryxellense TaxID=205328 RepID=UPI001C0D2363|nr:hypothetical protein [Clostridium lacusfryxellense]MBU3113249.1 hypothetical protein [Clostridium lacusfryxellense]